MSTNPNNCKTCKYKAMRSGDGSKSGFCYMFADAPTEICMQHTGRTDPIQLIVPLIRRG
jgi:hypothetical protein